MSRDSSGRPRWWVTTLAAIGALALVGAAVFGGWLGVAWLRGQQRGAAQDTALTPFYTAPKELPTSLGAIVRSEPIGFDVPGGTGYRIVYTTADAAGAIVPVSGMIFLPTAPAPAGGRKIFAFAHGTVGAAPKCAPSRASSLKQLGTAPWLEPALQQGWVVVATDYVGLGIPAQSSYLVGDQEARDVINSVRAALTFPKSGAVPEWIVYGSSQGGNSALWTAALANKFAPELPLKGVMAAVPAAELGATVSAQWDKAVSWALAPAILSSWPALYPDADFASTLTPAASKALPQLQSECIIADALMGMVHDKLGQKFFTSDPTKDPAWQKGIREQTPPMPAPELPMFLTQGTGDEVVLAGSNALLQEQWCAKRPMTSLWLGGVSHQDTSTAAGPAAVNWARERFAGVPPVNTCALGVPAPVEPLPNPLPRP